MRLTLFKYISREIWSVFFVSLLVFIFIVMGTRMMSIMDLLVNQGISPRQLGRIILCMLPQIVLFSLPAACLMSVMLAFIRLGSDNEIIALNASGISLYQMLPAVVLFSLICYGVAGLLAIYGVPWGNRSYKDYVQGIIKSKTNLTIKERIFFEPVNNVVFYVNSKSAKDNEMRDIFVVDRSDDTITNTIVAERGSIITGRAPNTINIHFINGTVFVNENDQGKPNIIKFDTYDWSYDLGDIAAKIASREKKPKEMYIRELITNLKEEGVETSKLNEMGIKLYEMFSIPFAIFLLGIIGSYLGSHVKARGRTTGIIISLLVFIAYYTSLMGSRYLCETGAVAPIIGVWLPVFLLSIIALFLLSRINKTGTFSLFH